MENPNPGRRSDVEKHVQTVLISFITGGVAFFAGYIFTDNSAKAVQAANIVSLTTEVREMRADIKSMQSNYVRRDEYLRLEERIRGLEARR